MHMSRAAKLEKMFRRGHLIKFLSAEFRRAEWENIWLSVTNSKCGSHCAPPAGHNLEPNIPPHSVNKYILFYIYFCLTPGA